MVVPYGAGEWALSVCEHESVGSVPFVLDECLELELCSAVDGYELAVSSVPWPDELEVLSATVGVELAGYPRTGLEVPESLYDSDLAYIADGGESPG